VDLGSSFVHKGNDAIDSLLKKKNMPAASYPRIPKYVEY